MEVVCIRHPKYKGQGAPVLSCKACCGLYVAEIRAKQTQEFEPTKWLEQKVEEARKYNPRK